MVVLSWPATGGAAPLDSLLRVLDEAIASHREYAGRREKQIELLGRQLRAPGLSDERRYQLTNRLYELYEPYICDSAIACLNRNIELADAMGAPRLRTESRIRLSFLLASTGMYMEASDVLHEVERSGLDSAQAVSYFSAYVRVYDELYGNTQDLRLKRRYRMLAEQYRDSARLYDASEPDPSRQPGEVELLNAGRLEEALRQNDLRLKHVQPDTREQAVAYHLRSLICHQMGRDEEYRCCLARSATADIRAAVQDHVSLLLLAQALFKDGDLERAYRYMDFSWSQTSSFNARLRVLQSVGGLSLIEDAYQMMLSRRNTLLTDYTLFSSLLLLLLVLALFCIWRQVKKLALARRRLQEANDSLHTLNERLHAMNSDLQTANLQLREANAVKENYLARFIKLCSTYVDRLDAYRRMVANKLVAGQTAELLKMARTPSAMDEALDELYANFDAVFLHIFPDFVERFNDLLRPGEQIQPKAVGQLCTELRIFALIRLGITDSSQIAEFLHYSVNTIYNYRAKVKNKARCRDCFEEDVARIG